METKRSRALFEEAKRVIPGGVNSPVRAFRAVGGIPRFIESAQGAYLTDVDGNRYIDYVTSFGPLILGHARTEVTDAITQAALRGTSYGASCGSEVDLARMITQAIPSMEMVRMVSSGTEATMSAVRLARAYTKRNKIIKFEGCYHGHGDSFLVKAGSGMLTGSIASSPGVVPALLDETIVCDFNEEESVRNAFAQFGEEIAALIVEPVPANMGLVLPKDGFLEFLRKITAGHGALLIFDEVITGFRTCYGGYQNICGVTPDLTTLGKIIGGGLPVGAYGGRRDIMKCVAPEGDVYQAGTLSGNPLAMAAGIRTLELLKADDNLYAALEEKTNRLCDATLERAKKAGVSVCVNRLGSLFTVFFTEDEVTSYADVARSDKARYARFHAALLESGVYVAPSQFEVAFVSAAHGEEEIDLTIRAIDTALCNHI